MSVPAFLLTLVLATGSEKVLILTNGEAMVVADYEVKGGVVLVHTSDGKLRSLPLELVDLEASERRSASEAVPLTFGWTPGMMAHVDATTTREREGDSRERSSTKYSYRLTVREHADGLEVHHDALEFDEMEAGAALEAAGLDASTLQRIAAMTPSYIIGLDGEFRGVSDVTAIKAAIDDALRPLRQSIGGENEELQNVLDAMLSEDRLTAAMQEDWNIVAGFWLDSEPELGASYELETSAPFPLVPGLELPMLIEFGATRRVPCAPNGVELDCVELRTHTYPDPEKLAELMEAFLERLASVNPAQAPRFDELRTEIRVTLIATPALVPYFLETIKNVNVTGTGPDGATIEVTQTDQKTLTYRWN